MQRDVTRRTLIQFLPHNFVLVVLLESDVPSQAANSRNRFELVDDAPGDEVDVVVVELDAGIADALSPQLVQLGVVDPLDALRMQHTETF